MKHLSHASFTRNTAVVVLLLWVFALASGVANACLLEAHDVHPHTDVMEAVEDIATSEFAHGKTVEIDHKTDRSKTPCQNFCDEESKLLIKQHYSGSQPDLAPVSLIAVLWNSSGTTRLENLRKTDTQPAAYGLALRVRYSRLTL